ncbi:MAG: DUF3883 domain-containing protein [Nanoarchaeota archaeon]
MATNKTTGDKGEKIVIDYFRRKGIKAIKAEHGLGYDVKAGKYLIEVKSTGQTTKQKNFFFLSQNEFLAACRNKNYWIYWVNIKENKIKLKISRNEILKHTRPSPQYSLYLSELKKKIED